MKEIRTFYKRMLLFIVLGLPLFGCPAAKPPEGASYEELASTTIPDTVAYAPADSPQPTPDLEPKKTDRLETAGHNKPPNIQILNSSAKELTVTLDDEVITMLPESSIYVYRSPGDHHARAGSAAFSFLLREDERVLLNPCKDTIVMEEILYSAGDLYASAEPADYTTPVGIITLGTQKYAGAYKIFPSQVLITHWHFAINERPKQEIGAMSALYRNKKSGKYISFFKISTPSELRKFGKPLNTENEWIEFILKAQVHDLAEGYTLSVEQSNHIAVNPPQGFKRSVAQGSINAAGQLELRAAHVYNQAEHGQIITQVCVIDNCSLEKEGKLLKNKNVAIVSVEDGIYVRVIN